jgi:uncharacterized protein YsxB (DUF464 family)
MVKVIVKKENDVITNINIKGHALYSDAGKDIVCASISSMLIITVNAIIEFDKDSISYTEENNFSLTNIKKDNITNKLLNNLVNHFKELELKYNKNINVKEE